MPTSCMSTGRRDWATQQAFFGIIRTHGGYVDAAVLASLKGGGLGCGRLDELDVAGQLGLGRRHCGGLRRDELKGLGLPSLSIQLEVRGSPQKVEMANGMKGRCNGGARGGRSGRNAQKWVCVLVDPGNGRCQVPRSCQPGIAGAGNLEAEGALSVSPISPPNELPTRTADKVLVAQSLTELGTAQQAGPLHSAFSAPVIRVFDFS